VGLPSAVHKVISRGREYFYFQAGRGTDHQGPRIRLPSDPHSPEFWSAIRQAQGATGPIPTDTINALIDAYLTTSPNFLKAKATTQYQYKRSLDIARAAWGNLRAAGLRPVHIQAVMDELAETPAKANAFLSAMTILSGWARARDHIEQSLTEGVEKYDLKGGHKPWTEEQIRAAHSELTGVIRRGVMLYTYTGQRGSDVVRLGETFVDEGGFRLKQQKTGREVWCPILPELAAEIATWERRPGPYLLQASGEPYSRKLFSMHFKTEREKIPLLKDCTLHGLRATAVIRLRREGLTTAQIQDISGMSLQMIERYCRFADKKISGQAALVSLAERAQNRTVKPLKN
jgi:integrase